MDSLSGDLFVYSESPRLVAFATGRSRDVLVFVPGLTDGLFSLPYEVPLAAELEKIGWSLVQPVLSSSYTGFGISSLDRDARELSALCQHLRERRGAIRIVLMGHSTGAQDTITACRSQYSAAPDAIILQGAVSDREYLAYAEPHLLATWLPAAERALAAPPPPPAAFFVPLFGVPVGAARFVSLVRRLGDDDLFSADLAADERAARLGHVRVPSLWIVSRAEEYLPPGVDGTALARTLASATHGRAEVVTVPGDHAVRGGERELCAAVRAFLQSL